MSAQFPRPSSAPLDKMAARSGLGTRLALQYTVRRKIFATEKFRESLPKRGGRNIRDKNIREGGSDTLRNTLHGFCVCVARRIFDGR